MRSLLAAALALCALGWSAARAEDAAPAAAAPQTGCDELFVGRHWRPAADAYQAQRFRDAVPDLDAIIAACGDDPTAAMAHFMRAEIALRSNDNQRALDVLAAVQTPGPPLGSYPVWMKLQALQRLGRTDDVTQLATTLLAASDAAMTRPDFGMQRVESFETADYAITGYQGRFNQGPFVRYFEFLMRPKAGGLPLSIALSRDAAALDQEKDYFIDLYECSGHYTLDTVSAAHGDLTYAEARRAVERSIADRHAVSSTQSPNGLCVFTRFITPGLD